MGNISIDPVTLYEGCVFAAIVHAVTAGEYPELHYEHSWDGLSSSQSWDEIWGNGGCLIRNQLLCHQESLVQWDDYYGLNEAQMNLIESLYERKIGNRSAAVYMNAEEMKCLYGDISECIKSLRELNIYPYAGYRV